ncbi:MAG TPA: glycosyltransferase family 1 protein [Bacteroidota bacterium]|jgi:glycosyltransferase involved in cell wall biosynthesis
MRVLIDDGLITKDRLSGIGHHGVQLWLHLRKLIDCELTDYSYLKHLPRVGRRVAYIALANAQSVYRQFDLTHYQNHYAPSLGGRGKKVMTIHDLVAFRYPETLPAVYRLYNQHAISSAIRHCDAIVTRSAVVKEEVLAMFPNMEEEKVYVCGGGLREVFFDSHAEEGAVRGLGLEPGGYFLFVGDLTARKNLKFLLEAFLRAKTEGMLSRSTSLVLVGKQAWGSWDFKGLLRKDLDVVALGYQSDEIVVSLYKYCKAVVSPSLYEGYGLPILEAMSQGAPIIASEIPATIELSREHSNQVLLFELGSQEQLLSQLGLVDRNCDTIRSKLQYGSLDIYRYDSVAKRHVEVYDRVLHPHDGAV